MSAGVDQAIEHAIKRIADTASSSGVPCETVVRHGVPHEEILEYAGEADVGLTVVGSKNRPGEYRRLPSSVAERVAHMSERPVTVVKTPVDSDE